MLRDAYKDVNVQLADLIARQKKGELLGSGVRRAQLEQTRGLLLAKQADVFARLGDIVSARRLRAAARSAGISADADKALLDFVGAGDVGDLLKRAALAVSDRQVETAMARMGLSQLPLSQRIYNTSIWMAGRLGGLINSTLAAGLNAQEFAKKARDWFNPSTPGGVRYAALRLARTEINNAFHAMSVQKAADTPWIPNMEWNLSKSHPKKDICNIVVEKDTGNGPGVYASEAVPVRPHPQCMCYVTPKSIDEDDFVENFLKGDYDDFLDAELDKEDARLGIKAAAANKPAPEPVAKIADRPKPELIGDDALNSVPKGLFIRGSLTPKQRKELKTYETGWFIVINTWIREGLKIVDSIDNQTARTVAEIDGAMDGSVLPSPIQTWRGMYRSRLLFGDRLDHDLTGFEWKEEAYGSTTTVESITDKFRSDPKDNGDQHGENVHMTVHVPAGIKGLQVSTATKGSEENGALAEIVLERGLKWRVRKDNGYDAAGVRQLEIEVDRVSPGSDSSATNGGTAERTVQSADLERAIQSVTAHSEPELTFEERLPFAAKGQKALDAAPLGLERRPRPDEFDQDMATALNRYTSVRYELINETLRSNDEPSERVSDWISNIDRAFALDSAKTTRDLVAYRGMRSGELFGDRLSGNLEGLEWEEQAYLSTTAVQARARAFNRGGSGILMRILLPEGTRAIEGSPFNAEAELIVDRGQRLRIVKDNGLDEDGVRLLDVELLGR